MNESQLSEEVNKLAKDILYIIFEYLDNNDLPNNSIVPFLVCTSGHVLCNIALGIQEDNDIHKDKIDNFKNEFIDDIAHYAKKLIKYSERK